MSAKDTVATDPPLGDEKVAHDIEGSTPDGKPAPPDDFREKDFMTRNGLNLRSFTRREFAYPSYDPSPILLVLT